MIFYLFKHYSRTILRRKLFSFINITGLAFGIAFIILIGQFIYYEVSYNSTLSNVDNIYRLVDADAKDYNIDYRIKDQIIESIPGVTNACLLNHYGVDVEAENKFFKIKHMLMVDSDFFKVFCSSFIYGNSKEALNSIDNIVLTETTAKNIFGTPDVIGKTLRLNHQSDMLITGVVKDFPENLSFGAELFVSFANAPQQRIFWKMACDDSKCRYPFNVFIELDKNANVAAAEERISSLHSIDNIHYPDNIILTPLSSDYFNTDYKDSDLLHGNLELIKLLSIIGVIVLLLAIINFVNLTT
ncbi:MAG: ABC transporter permease, partial [Ignavibacteria bacterium]